MFLGSAASYLKKTTAAGPEEKGGSGIRVPVLLTVRADEEVSLTETKRIRLLADYIQETKNFDL